MDYINKLKDIVPKMKMQMHSNKDIFSLNEIYMVIAGFDKENKGKCPRAKFENSFLSLLGIYLKTQELSELFKYPLPMHRIVEIRKVVIAIAMITKTLRRRFPNIIFLASSLICFRVSL